MGAAMTLQVRQFEIEARMIACRLQATTPAICDGRLLRVDCCSRRGRGSNASYEASSHKFFAPIDDKTILTAIYLIRLFLERREPRIGLGCRVKNSYVRRTLIRSAVSDTLKSFVIVEC